MKTAAAILPLSVEAQSPHLPEQQIKIIVAINVNKKWVGKKVIGKMMHALATCSHVGKLVPCLCVACPTNKPTQQQRVCTTLSLNKISPRLGSLLGQGRRLLKLGLVWHIHFGRAGGGSHRINKAMFGGPALFINECPNTRQASVPIQVILASWSLAVQAGLSRFVFLFADGEKKNWFELKFKVRLVSSQARADPTRFGSRLLDGTKEVLG